MILSFLTTFTGETVESRVRQARSGDALAREDLIRDYTPFILKTASSGAKRYLVQGRDEEVSVGLRAFDEAITAYSSDRPGFLAFAATVIRRRLIDFYRKEKRRDEVPFSSLLSDGTQDGEWIADEAAGDAFTTDDWSKTLERRDDIEQWTKVLSRFGITMKDVLKSVPKHADARSRAIRVAVLLSKDPKLKDEFMATHRLPIDGLVKTYPKEISSRKTLERQKQYITAIAAVLTYNLSTIADYLDSELR